ncbi:hypothetical protein Trydic_g4367 [Trypoxylus dichotomus]
MVLSRLIASCGQDVNIHDWLSGRTVYSLSPPNEPNCFFKNLSWSVTGNQLLTIPSGSEPVVVKQTNELNDACFTYDILNDEQLPDVGIFSKNIEEFATFGTASGKVYVVDVYTKDVVKTFVDLPSPVMLMDYTAKDTVLAVGCKSGQVFLYNTDGNVCSTFLVPGSYSLSSMAFHPCRELYLAAASREGVVAIWDIQSNTAKFVAKDHTKIITDIAISATDELLATVGLDRRVYIYDLRSKEVVFNKIFSSELSAIACSLVGEDFAIGTTRGRIFFVDKRQPDYTKGSISAQKGSVRGIQFCNNFEDEEDTKLNESLSEPILIDGVLSNTQISNIESDFKTKASGDFMSPYKNSMTRIPGGMDDGLDSNAEQWIEQLPDSVGDKQVPFLQVIEESSLSGMKEELIKCNKDILKTFMEEINAQFLKIRLGVSREFCRIEQNNNKRWQNFNATLLKLAGCEETCKQPEHVLSGTVTNESQNSSGSKPDSLYSPAKTRITNYSPEN